MKVAVTSAGQNLESPVDPRFGRAPYLVLVDTETREYQAMENTAAQAAGGAGVQAAQLVADQGVEALVTGNAGPNAFRTLAAAGVKVYVGAAGTVGQALEAFLRGELELAQGPSVPGHFGLRG